MKPPKNFYSNLDRRKQGLPEVPEASAADAGKVIKVGEDGAYELESGDLVPSVSASDNFKLIQVNDGEYSLSTTPRGRSFLITYPNRTITSTQDIFLSALESIAGNISFNFLNSATGFSTLSTSINTTGCLFSFTNKEGVKYVGIAYNSTQNSISALVKNCTDKKSYDLTIYSDSYTLTPIGS